MGSKPFAHFDKNAIKKSVSLGEAVQPILLAVHRCNFEVIESEAVAGKRPHVAAERRSRNERDQIPWRGPGSVDSTRVERGLPQLGACSNVVWLQVHHGWCVASLPWPASVDH